MSAREGGSPRVAVRIVLDLLLDVLSTPFHVAAFLLTRRRHRERFARMLAESRDRGPDPVP